MKSGFERIGHSVTVEHAKRSCLDKVRYKSRNAARDASARNAKRYPQTARIVYRCTLCDGFHLTTKTPPGLQNREGKRPTPNGPRQPAAKQSTRLPEEG